MNMSECAIHGRGCDGERPDCYVPNRETKRTVRPVDLVWDRASKKVERKERPSGITTMMGWERLAKLLDQEEMTGSEHVETITATEDGLYITIRHG